MEGLEIINIAVDKKEEDYGVITYRFGDLPAKTVTWEVDFMGEIEVNESNPRIKQALENEIMINQIESAWKDYR